MQKLKVRVFDRSLLDYVLINGENVEFKKVKGEKYYEGEVNVTDPDVEVDLDTFHPLLVPGWLILNIIFFVISIFGLFDTREKYKDIYNYHADITLEGNDNYIEFKKASYSSKACDVFASGVYRETVNEKVKDKRVSTRRGLLFLAKLLTFVVCVGALIAIGFIFFVK